MPPANTLKLMCWPRAAVRTAATLRRPTEQGTRWVGFPEWLECFGTKESVMWVLGQATNLQLNPDTDLPCGQNLTFPNLCSEAVEPW